jgi:NADP-dependent 3-hydroxy acid dehydrogenase YdfG
MRDPRSILITGAAGGLGSALAKAYAEPGIHLFLSDLDAQKLEALCDSCRELGAVAHGRLVDVTDKKSMEAWITEVDEVKSLDLVIANAGISHGNLRREETADQIRAVFAVNIDGTLNTILPVLPLFRERKRGQIAFMSSLAGLRGFPHSPSYCASKAAIRVFGQGLRARVKREGVSVSVIIPAFVKTPMTKANLYRMPGVIEADRAARIIKRSLARGRSEFVFPWLYPAVAWTVSAVPPSVMAFFTKLK